MTTSKQQPPINDDQPDPQSAQMKTSFMEETSEQRPLLGGPNGGHCSKIWLYSNCLKNIISLH